MRQQTTPESALGPEDEQVPHPRLGVSLLTSLGLGALGGMLAGVVIALYLGGIPAADEQRMIVSAVAFVAMIGSSVVVAALSLIWLMVRRSSGAAIVLGFTLLLPVATICTGLLVWR